MLLILVPVAVPGHMPLQHAHVGHVLHPGGQHAWARRRHRAKRCPPAPAAECPHMTGPRPTAAPPQRALQGRGPPAPIANPLRPTSGSPRACPYWVILSCTHWSVSPTMAHLEGEDAAVNGRAALAGTSGQWGLTQTLHCTRPPADPEAAHGHSCPRTHHLPGLQRRQVASGLAQTSHSSLLGSKAVVSWEGLTAQAPPRDPLCP